MDVTHCPRCYSSSQWTGSKCLECGYAIIHEEDFDIEVSDGVTIEPDTALPPCPECGLPFDGWDCKACGYALPPKHRKMHPKVVSPDEARDYLKDLGLSE